MMGSDLLRAAMCRAPGGVRPQDVFATSLYTGNGSTQTITNGINLSGEGGLVWIKRRASSDSHRFHDTVRGIGNRLSSDTTDAQASGAPITATSTGFSLDVTGTGGLNTSSVSYASWTFRRAPKFFDVVTYTGDGTAGRTIAHNLGVAPGMIIVKRTDAATRWPVWHVVASTSHAALNLTDAFTTGSIGGDFAYQVWGNNSVVVQPTSTNFTVSNETVVNASGGTYVAYLFAHDTDPSGIVQCGSYTGNGSSTGPTVTLGWRPQFLLLKNASGVSNWVMIDSQRGWPDASAASDLNPNNSEAEANGATIPRSSTGFQVNTTSSKYNASGSTYIYLAIREPT